MPAEMTVINLPDSTNFRGRSTNHSTSTRSQKSSSNNDFVSSLQKQQRSSNQSKSNSKVKQRNQSNNQAKQGNIQAKDNKQDTNQITNRNGDDKLKTQGQELENISQEKIKKLKKLLTKDADKLSDKDLEALLTNLSKILKKLSQKISQDMSNKEQLQRLVKSITANQGQLQKLMNSLNSEQSNKFKSLLKELNTVQEKLFLNENQQSNQAKAQAEVQTELKQSLKNTAQELQKLLQETNAKVIKTSNNSNSSQNLANQKILSQFNLVKPKDKQQNNKLSNKSDAPTVDLKKLGEKLGKSLIKQENISLKNSNSDKQIIDFKTVTNKNDANFDLSNLSNFKLGQFNTDAKVFSQSAATKSSSMKTMDFQNILKQMNNKINFNAFKQGNKITMQLEPEFLGKIQMKVGVENGSVTAKILAENNGVKDLLNGNLTKLKSTLEQKGIEIDQFDVSVGYQEEELAEQNNPQQDFLFKQQQEKNKLKNFSLKSEEGQLSAEELENSDEDTQVINDEVDYRA